MTGPTLSDLIRKWMRRRPFKRWMIYNDNLIYDAKVSILIGKDKVESSTNVGPFRTTIEAHDPMFFTKLSQLMKFVEGHQKRFRKNFESFQSSEKDLLKEIIGEKYVR